MSDLSAGRELDALVAERIMGWVLVLSSDGNYLRPPELNKKVRWFSIGAPDDPRRLAAEGPPEYSTDIAAAWEVVGKLGPTVWTNISWNGEEAEVEMHKLPYNAHWREAAIETAPTVPLAICRAALKVVHE